MYGVSVFNLQSGVRSVQNATYHLVAGPQGGFSCPPVAMVKLRTNDDGIFQTSCPIVDAWLSWDWWTSETNYIYCSLTSLLLRSVAEETIHKDTFATRACKALYVLLIRPVMALDGLCCTMCPEHCIGAFNLLCATESFCISV